MALSSCEAELMVATIALCEALSLRNLLSEVTRSELKLVTLYVDNKFAIALMKNPIFHGHNKLSVLRRDKSLWSPYAL